MKYCMNCGSELTDGAKFCTNCGTKVAPSASDVSREATESSDAATETIEETSDTATETIEETSDAETETVETIEENVDVSAPDEDGEFVVASWRPPRPKKSEKPKKQAKPKHTAKATETSKVVKEEKKVKPKMTVEETVEEIEEETIEPEEDDEPGWKYLIVNNFGTFYRVLMIAIGAVLAVVIIKGLLADDGYQSSAPTHPQEMSVQQQSTGADNKEFSTIRKPNHPVVQK